MAERDISIKRRVMLRQAANTIRVLSGAVSKLTGNIYTLSKRVAELEGRDLPPEFVGLFEGSKPDAQDRVQQD